jgi:hypothetical protein
MIKLQEKIATMSDVFTRRLVHDDDLISVYIIDHASPGDPALGADLDDQVPDTKCYTSHNQKPHEWIEKWKSLVPYGMMYIKNTDLFYDFGPQSHLVHNTNFSDRFNNSLSALAIRQAHPELEYFFNIDALDSMFSRMPLLGAHFDLAHMRSAYIETLARFRLQIETAFASGELNVSTHCFYNDLCVLTDRDTVEGLHVVLAQVLNDELGVNLGIILNNLQLGFTVEVLENQTQRLRVIKQAVDAWVSNSQFNRISKKILKQDHELCIILLRQHLVRFFQDKLSQTIYQVIEQ